MWTCAPAYNPAHAQPGMLAGSLADMREKAHAATPHSRMKTFAPHRVRSCSQVWLLLRGPCGQSRTSAHCQHLLDGTRA